MASLTVVLALFLAAALFLAIRTDWREAHRRFTYTDRACWERCVVASAASRWPTEAAEACAENLGCGAWEALP